jgi:hypothetical protein
MLGPSLRAGFPLYEDFARSSLIRIGWDGEGRLCSHQENI